MFQAIPVQYNPSLLSSIFAVEYDANLADCEFRSEKLVAFHCNIYEQAQRIRDAAFPEEENDGSTPAIYGPLRSQPWPRKESGFKHEAL
jgi:hypothetical protein